MGHIGKGILDLLVLLKYFLLLGAGRIDDIVDILGQTGHGPGLTVEGYSLVGIISRDKVYLVAQILYLTHVIDEHQYKSHTYYCQYDSKKLPDQTSILLPAATAATIKIIAKGMEVMANNVMGVMPISVPHA